MKLRENLRPYLTIEKVSKCWRCGGTLTAEDFGGTSGMPELVCPTCGFMVEVYSKQNKMFAWLFITALFALALGMFIGLSL